MPGVSTFVLTAENKVYMFKLDGEHDEEQMRAWINAIQVELSALPLASA